MGLFTGLLTLPLAPVRGVVWIAERVQEQAELQHSSPEAVSRRLAEVERAREAGEITEQESAEIEQEILDDLRWEGQ